MAAVLLEPWWKDGSSYGDDYGVSRWTTDRSLVSDKIVTYTKIVSTTDTNAVP
jgi:hypothetical protein